MGALNGTQAADSSSLFVPAGFAEHVCYRAHHGEVVHWRFNVSSERSRIRFSVFFYPFDSPSSAWREVEVVADISTAVQGWFTADAPGVLWFTWLNTGRGSRDQIVNGLDIGTGLGHSPASREVVSRDCSNA